MAENRVIGSGGVLPWRLPADMRHFKQLTAGHTVIMGRKTFEALDRPLPERRNVVVTRSHDYRPEGAEVVNTLADALALAWRDHEVFVAGGGEIYQQTLPLADRLYLTIVHTEAEGDVLFPELDPAEWTLREEERREADERHAFAFSFRLYLRSRDPA
jgi:dihydrofolate reductase